MSKELKVKGEGGKALSFPKLLPNIFTTIGLCSGLTGIRFAIEQEWQQAVFSIIVAACFDMIDGLSARLLKAFSRFGAELDSLADTISFGVAPSIITYLWIRETLSGQSNEYLMGWYWIPFLFYSACNAFRLARFNVMHMEETERKIKKSYFLGVPAPAGAGLMLIPMGIDFILTRFGLTFSLSSYPQWLVIWVVLIALMMVSRIPTFSFRNMRFSVSKSKAIFVLIVVSLAVAVLIKETWIFLVALGILYFISIPFSYWAYQKDQMIK